MFRFFQRHSHVNILFLRLATAMVFVYHGYLNLFGANAPEKIIKLYTDLGVPAAGLSALVVSGVQFFGGLFVGLGVLTRWASFFLLLAMVFVIFVVFRAESYYRIEQSIQLLLLSIATLYSGSGTFSFENLVKKHGD